MAINESQIGLVTVYVTQGMLRAMVVRGALESAGIPVMLSYEAIGTAPEEPSTEFSQVRVMVPVEWSDEARNLLTAEPPTGEHFSIPKDLKPSD